jgi:hypothetical protein
MKKQFDIKKLVLLNLPYLLMGLFTTNFGEAWRLAQGANASEKFLSLFAVLPGALQSFWPSLHPLDLLVMRFLSDRPNIKTVYLCLDSDQAGNDACSRLVELMPED